MSALGDIASLIVATMDLKAVQSVVTAIRVADLSGAATVGESLTDRYEPGRVFHPDARHEPRRVITPEPRYEQRLSLPAPPHERPALEPLAGDPFSPPGCACDPVSTHLNHTIAPPWSKVPWDEPMPARPVVKIVVRPPDVVRTGKLIDFYM